MVQINSFSIKITKSLSSLMKEKHNMAYLSSEIRDCDELLEDVLGQDVGITSLLDIIRWHVDMVGPEMQICGRDSPHAPLCLGGERCRLIVAGGWRDDLVTVFVHCTRRRGRQLGLLFSLFLDLGDLLSLSGGCWDLHTQDDVTDLRLSQRRNVYTVIKIYIHLYHNS